MSSFYPRHPRGWRLELYSKLREPDTVSIHATLAGGDGRGGSKAPAS